MARIETHGKSVFVVHDTTGQKLAGPFPNTKAGRKSARARKCKIVRNNMPKGKRGACEWWE